jgi:murein L,D-transpeptidase YafK
MKLRLTSFLLALSAIFLSTIGADAASKSWRPESVAVREIELAKEFSEKGLKLGSPVFLRVYKQTSEMELWVQQGPRYELFKIYKICRWSGGLGPKFYEGDRQSPEGLYRITTSDLIVNRRWDRAMNINYPNNFDQANGRGGSSILIHGGCGSIGCFAIQNQNVEEVYGAVYAALRNNQAYVPVLTLPFRYSALAPEKEDTLHMSEFWSDLRRADLLFERDKLPPTAWICDGRYYFADRRGDRRRHAVHLPGCKPLDNRAGMRDAKNRPEPRTTVADASTQAAESPQKAVEAVAQAGSPQKTVETVAQAGSLQKAVETVAQAGSLQNAVETVAQAGSLQNVVETVAQAGSPEDAAEAAAQAESPQKAVEAVAHANPRGRLQSRLRHAALKSASACPKKYSRCRHFVRAGLKRTRFAGRRSNILRIRRHSARGGGKLRRL